MTHRVPSANAPFSLDIAMRFEVAAELSHRRAVCLVVHLFNAKHVSRECPYRSPRCLGVGFPAREQRRCGRTKCPDRRENPYGTFGYPHVNQSVPMHSSPRSPDSCALGSTLPPPHCPCMCVFVLVYAYIWRSRFATA